MSRNSPGQIEINLEPEPPEKCPTCGASMYISDRDDDNLCDGCWEDVKKVKMSDYQRELMEQAQRIARGGELM